MGTFSEFQMIIASLLLLVGCDDTTFNGHSVEGDTIVAVLEGNCNSCHSGAAAQGSLDLAVDPCDLVGLSSLRGDAIVEAGDPEASVLYTRVVSESNPMPPIGSGEMLSDANVAVISDWILNEAPSCEGTTGDGDGDGDGDDTGQPDSNTFAYLWSNVFQGACSGCHSGDYPAGGVALSDADTAYASLLAGYVTANDPDNSMLMELLTSSDDDVRMPPGEPLSDAEVDAVRAWINNGAVQ